MRTITSQLSILGFVFVLSSLVTAQWSIDSQNANRSGVPNQGASATSAGPGYATSSQQNGPGVLSVPQVMPVVRNRAKPMIALFEGDAKIIAEDKVISRLDARRKKITGAMRAARRDQNMVEASQLLRELESIRQDRLERMRRIAPPAATDADSGAPEKKIMPEKKKDGEMKKSEKEPVLPLPTRPKAKSSET